MLFSHFLPIVLLVYYSISGLSKMIRWRAGRKVQNYFLFFESLLFYAYGEIKFVFIVLISIAANWLFGKSAGTIKRNRAWFFLLWYFSIYPCYSYLNILCLHCKPLFCHGLYRAKNNVAHRDIFFYVPGHFICGGCIPGAWGGTGKPCQYWALYRIFPAADCRSDCAL